jgi:hypothetical protein
MGWLLAPGKLILWLIFGKTWKEFTWNWMFIKLMNLAPQIWGGKYGAKVHGRKSRQWLYGKFQPAHDHAEKTPILLDDNAMEWNEGFFLFDVEQNDLVGQLSQAIADIQNGHTTLATDRLVQVFRSIKMPV